VWFNLIEPIETIQNVDYKVTEYRVPDKFWEVDQKLGAIVDGIFEVEDVFVSEWVAPVHIQGAVRRLAIGRWRCVVGA
jgi:hypothetical protein